jgi:hypothetical protein
MLIIASIVTSLFILSAIAVAYAWLASRVVRRWPTVALLPLWAAVSTLVTFAFVLRLARLQGDMEIPGAFAAPFPAFWQFLPLWALGFGAVSLYVARRARRGRTGFDGGMAIRSVGAFLAGVLILIVAYGVWDARRLF